MPKFLLFILFHLFCTASGQLLNIKNLQNLSGSPGHIIDTKLSAHFDLLHQEEASGSTVKVYSNEHMEDSKFMVVTVFLRNEGCHVFSIVSHDDEQVSSFKDTLNQEKFKSEKIQDKNKEEVSVFEKNNIKVLIKNPNHSLAAHQIVWMCK
ncbi:hypothetical protein [Chryseobacterium caseinilyticum]|uniref:Uncharacterized protein n=1 Tax=Chryseobacterium caseinilyticum TaxID=2771428 RepID=A0ABR8Z879_9FLAO|nr:hypothetical protein [Chryseobacterium caseinilyticum]MBD8081504.1 hypothetical protein [Chryseobacterium caseinilyticum]